MSFLKSVIHLYVMSVATLFSVLLIFALLWHFVIDPRVSFVNTTETQIMFIYRDDDGLHSFIARPKSERMFRPIADSSYPIWVKTGGYVEFIELQNSTFYKITGVNGEGYRFVNIDGQGFRLEKLN